MNRRLLSHPLIPMAALAALSLAVVSAAACTRHTPTEQAAAPATSSCLPSHDGYLRVRLRGARNLDIDWHDADLECEGGERPGQRGLRLAFAGPVTSEGHRLRFVFGMASAPGIASSREVPANVTVIFEGDNGLYSTRGDDKCTIDELTQAPIDADAYRVVGRGFCSGPATSFDGTEHELVSRFDFAGRAVDAEVADHPQ